MKIGVFKLEINLGNEHMQSPEQIAEALRRTAAKMLRCGGYEKQGGIFDTPGNRVGAYRIYGREEI